MFKAIIWFSLGYTFAKLLLEPAKKIGYSQNPKKKDDVSLQAARKVMQNASQTEGSRHHDILFQKFSL